MKFKSDIEVQAGIKDYAGSSGTAGQVLSSDGATVTWIDAEIGVASDVQNEVKAGVAINKGQAVYVTSADGTNIIVGLASNTSEATSSKTLGLLNATVAANGFADVVQIGKLSGLNTIGANIGDPVWLGTNGNLIYGLANKPYAPAHLVYIGVVTRVNANNGEIFVTVQNGFELKEIHDVDIVSTAPVGNDILAFEGAPVNLWKNKTIPAVLGYTPADQAITISTTAPLSGGGNLSANRTLSIVQANATTNGYLSSADWTTFNNKQTVLNGTGFVKVSGTTVTYDNSTYVPTTRTITINGVTQSLAANQTWTVTGGVSGSGVAGQVAYWDGTTSITGESNLFWDSTNDRLGIGTALPSAKLEVLQANGNGLTSGFSGIHVMQSNTSVSEDVAARMTFNADGGATVYGFIEQRRNSADSLALGTRNSTGGAGYISLVTQGTEKTRVFGNGNVFMGNTPVDAGYKLEVMGSTRITGGSEMLYLRSGSDSTKQGRIGVRDDGAMQLYSYQSGVGYKPVLLGVDGTATAAGNVGVGVISPGHKFHVYDNTQAWASLIQSANSNAYLSHGAGYGFAVDSTTATANVYLLKLAGGNGVNAGTVERFRVTGTGSVLVGTGGTDSGHKLDVVDSSTTFVARITNNQDSSQGLQVRTSDNDSSLYILDLQSSSTATGTDYASKFVVAKGGNVGIGALGPDQLLTLSRAINNTTIGLYNTNANTGNRNWTVGTNDLVYGDFAIIQSNANGGDPVSAGTKRFYINPSGNVGIGSTVDNGVKLYVESQGEYIARFKGPGDGTIIIGGADASSGEQYITYQNGTTATNAWMVGMDDDEQFKFSYGAYGEITDANSKMTILQSGNVGIGTTSPSYKLSIQGSAGIEQSEEYFYFNSTYSIGNNARGKIRAVGAGGGSGYGGDLRFSSRASNNVWNEDVLTIANTGNVGIGTSSPSFKLQVEDSSIPTVAVFKGGGGGAYSTFNIMTLGANGDGYWRASTIGSNIKMVSNAPAINATGFSASAIAFGADSNQGRIGFFTTSSNTGDALLTESLRINTTGNVLINTTTDAGYKLDVNGTGRFTTELKVKSANYPTTYNTRLASDAGATGILQLGNNGLNCIWAGNTNAGGYLEFKTSVTNESGSGNLALTLDSNGRAIFNNNVGLSITNPRAALQIDRSSWAANGKTVSRMLQKNVGIAGDYEQHVILLHPIYNGTLIDYNKCSGTIYATRGGAGMGLINDTYHLDTASAYNSFNGTVNSTIGYGRLYTCNYNGVKYMALLPDYRTSAVEYDFDGYVRSTGEELKVIVYRMSNTGTIVNSEVNNSLAVYASGTTYYQGVLYTTSDLYADGNCGIGTTTPGAKLNVRGPLGAVVGAGGSAIRLTNSDTGAWASISAGVVGVTNEGMQLSTEGVSRLVLSSAGNVLIGTTTDAGYKLDVNGNARVQTAIGVNAAPNTVYPVTIGCTSGASGLKIIGRSDNLGYIEFFNNNGTTVNSSLNGSTGGLQVTGATTFSSTVTATGFFNSSDIRLKEIVDYDYNISNIKPISYLWKDSRDNKKHIGYSAQEVQKVMPDAVNEDADGMLSVNYIEILVAKIAELENRIKQLEK